MANRARTSRRLLVLVFVGAPLGYVACSTSTPPPAALPASDGGPPGDSGAQGRGDTGLPFDANLIPPPQDATPGAPCTASTDCAFGLDCLYPIVEGCAAHAICAPFAPFDGSPCGGPYCKCAGDTTGVCGGYGYAPMQYPLRGPPCMPVVADGGGLDSGASTDAGGTPTDPRYLLSLRLRRARL